MKILQRFPVVATAFALFAMLFGSGNIAFPLGLGRNFGDMAIYAMFGFFITAALIPIVGVIAMALYRGDYCAFMYRIGYIPGAVVIFICLALMGPLCVIPRCIAFSHLALQWIFPSISLFVYSIAAGIGIFLLTMHKRGVVDLMSIVLGPLKIVLLSTLIVYGLCTVPTIAPCMFPGWESFQQGLLAGPQTLDLLGVIFFSGLLFAGIVRDSHGTHRTERQQLAILIKAGILGALMLGIMYAGFVLVAARQSAATACAGIDEAQLLSVLASIILGAGGGYVASITMAVACMTTALALTTVFASYLSSAKVLRLSYYQALLITTATATYFANYGSAGIRQFLAPIVIVLYPALIILAITNICYKTWNIDMGKAPFYAVLIISAMVHWIPTLIACWGS